MAAGEVIHKVMIAGQECTVAGLNICYDIMNPYGPVAEVRLIDPVDFMGEKNINGGSDQDVEISLTPKDESSGKNSIKFKMFQSKNLNDNSIHNTGVGKHKQVDIRLVSEELLNAQGNYIQKSFKGKTSDVVKHILEKGFKTKKQIKLSNTKGNRTFRVNNKHPLEALHDVNNEHVSDKYESSCFVTFQQGDKNGEHTYHFKTFEEMFEQSPVVKLTQTSTLDYGDASDQDRKNSIMWFKPSDGFLSATRSLSKPSEQTIDLTTHKVVSTTAQPQDNFKYADKDPVYKGAPSNTKEVPIRYQHNKVNHDQKHTTSSAKSKRAAFLSHLAQNSADLECYYNPDIQIGKMIELNIPAKTSDEGNEKQFNGKCLVVSMRIKYKIANEPPNCTMILRVVKASYKEGGNGNA